jgi:hypothetical protein
MIDFYQRSLADVPVGVTAGEWEVLHRYNGTRLRQEVLEFAFGPEPIKAGILTGLWYLGCPLSIVLAAACASVAVYTVLCWRDQQRLAAARSVAAKLMERLARLAETEEDNLEPARVQHPALNPPHFAQRDRTPGVCAEASCARTCDD